MLYPTITSSRMVFDLNGVWDFRLMKHGEEFSPTKRELFDNMLSMPVPSSYNDIYSDREFSDHVGNMLYKTEFIVNEAMLSQRLFLRFGSVTHKAEVWVNGIFIGSHTGGFLPFEFDITEQSHLGRNELTVVVNNIVDYSTLPAGRLEEKNYPILGKKVKNSPNFDFYNYTGIMRPVVLYTSPVSRIEDISVYGNADGTVFWDIKCSGEGKVTIHVLDERRNPIYEAEGEKGEAKLKNINLWTPESPYLYQLSVHFEDNQGHVDEYEESFGFREITIHNCRLYLNGKPIYLKGFGKHEDSPVRGRGFDMAYNVKDIGLMKWIGANSFRTSHYPYSEEMLRLCDREGIMVIAETPAVGLNTGFTATGMLKNQKSTWETVTTHEAHRQVITDLINRDKNHPSVIMWSVANEPASHEEGAKEYFEPLVNLAKKLDVQKRPVTIVTYEAASPETCKVAELCDVLMINRYRGWYDNEGELEGAGALLKDELLRFHKRCPEKPIMLGEYGADTLAGLHTISARMFSEEYQVEYLKKYSEVFDELDFITGEHIWNFADFATCESVRRVNGNKKGIFTREREPKMAAYFMRERWKRKNTAAERRDNM